MVYRKKHGVKKQNRLKKRWYASADLGVFGKYSIGNGSMPKTKRALSRFVKRSVMEPKLWYLDSGITSILMDRVYIFNITAQLQQGSASNQRLGDKVFLKALNIKTHFEANLGAQAAGVETVSLRAIVFAHDLYDNPSGTNISTSAVIGAAQIFQSTVSPIYRNTIDFKQVVKLCDKTYNFVTQSGTNSGIITKDVSMRCPINTSFQYNLGSAIAKGKNLYVAYIPYAFAASPGVTTICSVRPQFNVSFSD